MTGQNSPPPATTPTRELPLLHLLELSIYWFGISIIWGGLDGVIIPHRLEQAYPDDFGLRFAIISAAAVIMAIVVQPTVGMISDYTITRWGRRKPFIVIGALLDVVFLVGVASSQEFLVLLVFMVLLQFSSNFAQGPFQGYVPDLVPAKQVGLASGLMGLMLVLGRIAGVGIGTLGILTDSLWIATVALGVVEVATMVVLVRSVHEGTAAPARPGTWWQIARSAWGADILRERNVLWLLLVRLLFLGAIASTSLGLSYFGRTHGLDRDAASSTLFIGTVIVGVATAARRRSRREAVGPIRPQADDLPGMRGGRPRHGRRRAGSVARLGSGRLRAVRARDGDLPLGRLGAHDRRHPQGDDRALHGDPERGDRGRGPGLPDRGGRDA